MGPWTDIGETFSEAGITVAYQIEQHRLYFSTQNVRTTMSQSNELLERLAVCTVTSSSRFCLYHQHKWEHATRRYATSSRALIYNLLRCTSSHRRKGPFASKHIAYVDCNAPLRCHGDLVLLLQVLFLGADELDAAGGAFAHERHLGTALADRTDLVVTTELHNEPTRRKRLQLAKLARRDAGCTQICNIGRRVSLVVSNQRAAFSFSHLSEIQ